MQDGDNQPISPTEAALIDACDDVNHAALEIMKRVGDRLDRNVILGTASLKFEEEDEPMELSMTLRFTLPKGRKRTH